MSIGIGLYGLNGHQIQGGLAANPKAHIAGVAGITRDEAIRAGLSGYPYHETLEGLLSDPGVEAVSLCSPRRDSQAADAIMCLGYGKHVYAEKPAALSEGELDGIIAVASGNGRVFREMAGTSFETPYIQMRQVVDSGVLGTIVQVHAQKSYPYHDRRPHDEGIDGGLTLQVGIHSMRMIVHTAGLLPKEAWVTETVAGSPEPHSLRMASALMARCRGGALATMTMNYLNPTGFGSWGNETLRIFGTNGMVEAVDGGTRTRLVIGDRDFGGMGNWESAIGAPLVGPIDYLDAFIDTVSGAGSMPITLERELLPLRILLRAKSGGML